MKTSDFDYDLPTKLIAQSPASPRSTSRLMVIEKKTKKLTHTLFNNLSCYLDASYVLVLNDTRVMPARLWGRKSKTDAKVEVLLLRQLEGNKWEVLVKPAKRLKDGAEVVFNEGKLRGLIEQSLEDGKKIVSFECDGDFEKRLEEFGQIPLPPYIHKPLASTEDYQTVYSRKESSVAAPTAGLHFTGTLIEELKSRGVDFSFVTLDIGLDTFQPVREENVENHKIHREYFSLSQQAANRINRAISENKKVVAVGTTSARVLESTASSKRLGVGSGRRYLVKAQEGWTDLFIYPGYKFKVVDCLLTNFHLPKSTLLMMVAAFAGTKLVKEVYQTAINQRYRFFSFGDAMLIV